MSCLLNFIILKLGLKEETLKRYGIPKEMDIRLLTMKLTSVLSYGIFKKLFKN